MFARCQNIDLRGSGCLDLFCPGDQLVDHVYIGGIWVGVMSEATPGTL